MRTSSGFYEHYAYTEYDYINNTGMNSVGSYKYILTKHDATNAVNAITVPTNGSKGIRVRANELFAYTVSYRPGFKYSPADTIDETVSPQSINLHSHFSAMVGNSLSKGSNADYKQSLSVITANRHNIIPGWNGRYIPGCAWNNYNQILWSLFYIRKEILSNDARIYEFSSPQAPMYHPHYCENDSISVVVELANSWGIQDLTTATISWIMDGVIQKDYLWTERIKTGGLENVSLGSFPFSAGIHSITAWASNPNGVADSFPINDTFALAFYVNPFPDARFTASKISTYEFQFVPRDLSLFSYYWLFDDGTNSHEKNPSHLFLNKGNDTVYLFATDKIGCRSKSDTIITIENVGIQRSIDQEADFTLSPNPFNNTIYLGYNLETDSRITIGLFDAFGTQVCILKDEACRRGTHLDRLNTEKYQIAPGLYIMKFCNGDGCISKRIVKL